ncbi:DUF4259 domain-containing protein [Bradyrhizobium sp. BRP22]|nr:DUF4259 domain-containing protein [Bradyrhizobium sp. BRP22]
MTPQSPLNDESASRALAAAEIVAAMMGSPSRHLSASCKEWAARRSRDANRDLTELAVRAVDRVGNDSETQELMQEGEGRSLQDWQASVADLKAQLISR